MTNSYASGTLKAIINLKAEGRSIEFIMFRKFRAVDKKQAQKQQKYWTVVVKFDFENRSYKICEKLMLYFKVFALKNLL